MPNLKLISAAAGAFLTLLAPAIAHADLAACGDVWLFGAADCKFVPTEECTTTCEPVAMETSCAARLYSDCNTTCTATADAGCTTTCLTSCGTTCDVEQVSDEPPNSMGQCMSSCQQDCNDACDGAEHGECRSTCAHNCGEKCEQSKCRDDDADVECAPKCGLACEGSCWATASSECQISCSLEQYSVCKTDLVERCHEECEQTGGAIFCGGQFLNATDIQACADEIEAEFSFHVEVKAKAEVDAEADGDGVFGCTVDPDQGLGGMLLALGLLGVTRRRRPSA
jgi:MYXO-CTERM domain-containing protein